MEAHRLEVQCPICNQSLYGEVKSHLSGHSKREVVDELMAYMETEYQGE